jgi:hypothetical protein
MNRIVVISVFILSVSFNAFGQNDLDTICFKQDSCLKRNEQPIDGYTYFTIKHSGNNGLVFFIDRGSLELSHHNPIAIKKYLKAIDSKNLWIKRKGWNDWTIYNQLEGKTILLKTTDNKIKRVELIFEIE